MKDVQVRIGNADSSGNGQAKIYVNPVCGSTLPPKAGFIPCIVFSCAKPLSGRYLTAQTMTKARLEITEIDVYVDSSEAFLCGTKLRVPVRACYFFLQIGHLITRCALCTLPAVSGPSFCFGLYLY